MMGLWSKRIQRDRIEKRRQLRLHRKCQKAKVDAEQVKPVPTWNGKFSKVNSIAKGK
jgi:hypothetical protein